MTTQHPQWSDSDQGDLLELVAQGSPSLPTADEEWLLFVGALKCARVDGVIRPNVLRPLIRGFVKPTRIGAFTSRALAQALIAYTGEWEISDDAQGRNSGKPARVMRWLGGGA